MTASPKARLIAFYLPQYHPIPENDEWWGKGFTEWTNVAKARPLFKGHYQPHLPADLGFYDLRLPEVREAQVQLAREHGIHGFCYYHYWFNGKRLLERPFNEVVGSGKPEFPFCLCWANESWSRRWTGEEVDLLAAQTYEEQDHVRHARWLAKAFRDPRYIRVGQRPVFLVYRPSDLPEPARTASLLKTECVAAGASEPYLVAVDSFAYDLEPKALGFDAVLCFEPKLGCLPRFSNERPSLARFKTNLRLGVCSSSLKLYDYAEARAAMVTPSDSSKIPCVLVRWDNSPRRNERGVILLNSAPEVFGAELRSQLTAWLERYPTNDLFFLNAWNEWGEGNHLEPDQRYGRAYLEQVRAALEACRTPGPGRRTDR